MITGSIALKTFVLTRLNIYARWNHRFCFFFLLAISIIQSIGGSARRCRSLDQSFSCLNSFISCCLLHTCSLCLPSLYFSPLQNHLDVTYGLDGLSTPWAVRNIASGHRITSTGISTLSQKSLSEVISFRGVLAQTTH